MYVLFWNKGNCGNKSKSYKQILFGLFVAFAFIALGICNRDI